MNRWIVGGTLAGAYCALLASRPARVRVASPVLSDPETLLDLVAQVEREPELIPFVQHVRVEDRADDTVRYRVEVIAAGIPGWARFQKAIRHREGRADWTTLDGMLGFDQEGRFVCERGGGGTRVVISATTRFKLPVLGALLAHASSPVLAYAFSRWLENLDAAAGIGDRENRKGSSTRTDPAARSETA
jgi:hypothetical protein